MFKLNEEKMFHDVADGIAVVINFTTGVYYGFNPFGTAVLDCLLAGGSPELIAEAARQVSGCPDNIDSIILSFVENLKEKEILLETAGMPSASAMPPVITADSFIPEIEEFTEVQDLILADPIHEVDPEKGWPNVRE